MTEYAVTLLPEPDFTDERQRLAVVQIQVDVANHRHPTVVGPKRRGQLLHAQGFQGLLQPVLRDHSREHRSTPASTQPVARRSQQYDG